MPSKHQDFDAELGYVDWMSDDPEIENKKTKWWKGLDAITDRFSIIHSESAWHRMMGVKSKGEAVQQDRGELLRGEKTELVGLMAAGGKKVDQLQEAMYELGLDWISGKSKLKGFGMKDTIGGHVEVSPGEL